MAASWGSKTYTYGNGMQIDISQSGMNLWGSSLQVVKEQDKHELNWSSHRIEKQWRKAKSPKGVYLYCIFHIGQCPGICVNCIEMTISAWRRLQSFTDAVSSTFCATEYPAVLLDKCHANSTTMSPLILLRSEQHLGTELKCCCGIRTPDSAQCALQPSQCWWMYASALGYLYIFFFRRLAVFVGRNTQKKLFLPDVQ